MNVIAMSNGKVENQGTDSSVESIAPHLNGTDKMDQILTIVSEIQTDVNKVNTRLSSIEGSVKAIGLKLDGFRD